MTDTKIKRPRFGSPRLPATFWARTQRNLKTGCWEWTGFLDKEGYPAAISINSLRQGPHRHAYLALIGPIPTGLTLDHLCRVRHCVSPTHLEPCTRGENASRAKALVYFCPKGHPYDEENTIWVGKLKNRRGCRTCYNDRSRRYWHTTRKCAEKVARRANGYHGGVGETSKCGRGHLRTKENTYIMPNGYKTCKVCRNERTAEYNARKRTKAK